MFNRKAKIVRKWRNKEKIRERYTGKPVESAPTTQSDVASQVSSLKNLLDSGALSEDEFQRAKARLLGI